MRHFNRIGSNIKLHTQTHNAFVRKCACALFIFFDLL